MSGVWQSLWQAVRSLMPFCLPVVCSPLPFFFLLTAGFWFSGTSSRDTRQATTTTAAVASSGESTTTTKHGGYPRLASHVLPRNSSVMMRSRAPGAWKRGFLANPTSVTRPG